MTGWTRIFGEAIWAGVLFFLVFFILANLFLSFFTGIFAMSLTDIKDVFAWIFGQNYSLIILWLMFLLAFRWSDKKLSTFQHFLLALVLGIFGVGLSFVNLLIQFANNSNLSFINDFNQISGYLTSPALGTVLLLFFAPIVYKFRNTLKLKSLFL